MTVAFDVASQNGSDQNAGDFSWTHTPVGTPRSAIVWVYQHLSGGDEVDGVTYGGTAMTQLSVSPLLKTATEVMAVHAFFLGASVPTGAQTVLVDTTGAGAIKRASCITLTAAADCEIVDQDTINNDSVANPSVALQLASRTCFVAIGFMSGHNVLGSITPNSGWTDRFERVFSSDAAGMYSYNTIGSADVSAGWTQTAEDAAAIAAAISEIQAAGVASRRMMMMVGR